MRRYALHVLVACCTFAVVAAPGRAAVELRTVADWFLVAFGRATLWGATACVVLCAALAVSPAGRLRVGGAAAKPEFGTLTWLAMLFAAGMGAGLVFWGAAEPLIHAVNPPPGTTGDPVVHALALTQFHWSLHAWAIYAVAALAVSLAMRPGAAPLPSTPFERWPRPVRRVIDWGALVAVLFGLVASLGQGVFQMGAGAAIVSGGGFSDGPPLQLGLLAVLLLAYGASAASGLSRGIALLSRLNVGLALVLMAFVLFAGPTGAAVSATGQSAIAYLSELPRLSFDLRPEGAARDWTRDWTLTYLLWWVAWTPFVGVFIARISVGRTVRTFVAGVVLVPALATLLWFSVLGGAALALQAGGASLGVEDFAAAPQATYALLGTLPVARLTQAATLALVFLFLVTSADSGAYVLGLFARAGEPPIAERLFWGALIAALTAAAVWSEGGQAVTRAFAVVGAIPLCALLLAQGATLCALLLRPAWRQSNIRSKKLGSEPDSRR